MPHELSYPAFRATFGTSMIDVSGQTTDPVDIWSYVASLALPGEDLAVSKVYRTACHRYDHALLPLPGRERYLVVVVDLAARRVHGHHFLNLAALYGID